MVFCVGHLFSEDSERDESPLPERKRGGGGAGADFAADRAPPASWRGRTRLSTQVDKFSRLVRHLSSTKTLRIPSRSTK